MPRVALSAEQRRDYKLLDFKIWVNGMMKRHHKTQREVGEALGLSQVRISQMLKIPKAGKREKVEPDPFTYGQVLTLCEFFRVEEEERKKLLML
ncbi:MAG: hypothetical protein NC517_09950 [Firmicutes bacterium]|nr:hypothetical protein [Bacillota bacterium]